MKRESKFLSLVLRHEPARIGITLDASGWTDVAALLAACAAHGVPITRDDLAQIVATSDKQRFALSPDGARIRANQGHSVDVELGLAPASPPTRLYHGTVAAALSSIRATGLEKRARHHVHLSADRETATRVGARHGRPVVLVVRADAMVTAGHTFFRSENGVWLTDRVPPTFLDFPAEAPPHPPGRAQRRADRVHIAQATLAACEAGHYDRAPGERVELARWIEQARRSTRLFAPGDVPARPHELRSGEVTVTAETTLEALRSLSAHQARLSGDGSALGTLGCLNFASALSPGGGFLGGAQAQEETLARSSALYPCLLEQPTYYARQRAHGSPMYLDLAIVSTLVPFFRDDDGGWLDAPILASVVTCAAPMAIELRRLGAFDAAAVEATLQRRAAFVLDLAASEGIEQLVLGAWGAGAFGNDPVAVAAAFAEALATRRGLFERIVFAVPPGPNHATFAARFGRAT